MTKRIGPQMLAAVAYVEQHPGCAIRPVAHAITPNPRPETNEALGYNPVHRAIGAGLILATHSGGRYALYAAESVLAACLVLSTEQRAVLADMAMEAP